MTSKEIQNQIDTLQIELDRLKALAADEGPELGTVIRFRYRYLSRSIGTGYQKALTMDALAIRRPRGWETFPGSQLKTWSQIKKMAVTPIEILERTGYAGG